MASLKDMHCPERSDRMAVFREDDAIADPFAEERLKRGSHRRACFTDSDDENAAKGIQRQPQIAHTQFITRNMHMLSHGMGGV